MAIMTFSSDVKVVEDFTDDRDLLTKDIKNLIIGEGQGFDVTTADDSTPTPARPSPRTIPNSNLQHRPAAVGAGNRRARCWAR